jgi:translation initiation factor IF-3
VGKTGIIREIPTIPFLKQKERERKKKLQIKMVTINVEESVNEGLSLNTKTTQVLSTLKTSNSLKCNIIVKGAVLKCIDKFKYLCTIITSDGTCISESEITFEQLR